MTYTRILAGLIAVLWAGPASADIVVTLPWTAGTVTFSGSPTQGVYANGDPWVNVGGGSTTIVTRSGADTDGVDPVLNGCQINPLPTQAADHFVARTQNINQGYDSRNSRHNYLASLNPCRTYPTAAIPAGSSVMIGTSRATCLTASQGAQRCIETVEVITIVSSAPLPGQFRPPWAGTNKALVVANKSQIRYDVLHDYATGMPNPTTIYNGCWFQRPLDILSGSKDWTDGAPTSSCNIPILAYGRSMQHAALDALAALNGNYSDAVKEPLAIRMAQIAIDIYGQYMAGQWFTGLTGYCWPSKELLIFGASLLNNGDMMAVAHQNVSGNRFCSSTQYKRITSEDVTTARNAKCGDNNGDGSTICVPFDTSMIGKSQWCAEWPYPDGKDCSAALTPDYYYMPNGVVGIAMILSEMSLEEEHGNPGYFDYLLSRSGWSDNRWYTWARTQATLGGVTNCFTATSYNQNSMSSRSCILMDTYRSEAATNGSITGGPGPTNTPPSSALTGPSTDVRQTTAAATITLSGTAADGDGTVTSTTCASSLDASVTNSGTATAWSCTVDLPAASASTVTVTSTDDDGATIAIPISVLRASNVCTGLADAFTLNGTWPTLNPFCWGLPLVGALSWENNHARSTTAARNFYLYNSPITNDQMASARLDVTPDTATWIYLGVRGSRGTGTNYSGMGCTAQNPISYIATFVDTQRTTFHTIDMAAAPWVATDVASCRVIGQQYCLLKNGVVQGTCQTDGVSTFTSGGVWSGAWGASGAFSNFVGTSQAGGGDTVPPLISMTTPTGPTQVSATPYTLMAGTASDAVGVVSCVWSVAQNPAIGGACGGTTLPATSVSWTVPSIALLTGNNTVQVRVADAAGHSATTTQVLNYVPLSSVVATFTYPTSATTWTQLGRLVDLMGTFTMGECASVLLTNVSDPNPVIGGTKVVAAGTDSWYARVGILKGNQPDGSNDIEVACMTGAGGTGTSKLTVHKFVTYVPLAVRQ